MTVENRSRSPPSVAVVSTTVTTAYLTMRRTSKRSMPDSAALPSSPIVSVCTAASSAPKRWLTTPVVEEQLEGVGGNAELVEQEGHRRVEAAEEREEAGERRACG